MRLLQPFATLSPILYQGDLFDHLTIHHQDVRCSMVTGEVWSGNEAHQLGLIDEVATIVNGHHR